MFLALHGPFGEDGTVQALCEAAGLAYTGSGVTASAIGMDKAVFKRLIGGLGLPVMDAREVRAARWARDRARRARRARGVRRGRRRRAPDGQARAPRQLGRHDAGARRRRSGWRPSTTAFRYDDLALVERYLAGARDLEVAVIGNEPDALELYGPGEVLSGHEFYDYAAKYTPGLSETTTNAEVTAIERAAMLKLARDAYRAIGCEGFARVDFLLSGERLVVSEINTIPGFTPISLFPTLPAAGGYDFAAVCRRVVDLALERAAARVRHRLTAADLPR